SQVVSADDAPHAIRKLLEAPPPEPSALHATILARVRRPTTEVAAALANRYPETPGIAYIPAVAWVNALALSRRTGDASLVDKVQRQTAPWTSGGRPLFEGRILLTSVAGTMIFAELGGDARRLA